MLLFSSWNGIQQQFPTWEITCTYSILEKDKAKAEAQASCDEFGVRIA